jgi:crotonobetainyl-CoA:carnitine CoA-transferase CaiB-like acyl-CoA transferase
VSLLETAIDLQFEHLSVHLNRDGPMPARAGVANGNVYLAAPYGIYPTANGYLALAMTPVDGLGAVIGLPALADFPRESWFAARDAIKALIRDHLATRSTADWLALLEPAGIWAAPVLDWPAFMAEPAFAALGATQRVRSPDGAELSLTRCPIRVDGAILTSSRAGPRLGADRAAIDQELAE